MTEMTTLFEFKAGMMNATENASHKFDVVADPRKGRVCLTRDQHGSAHVVWKLRPSGAVEEDLLVFPDNQTFSKVNTGRADDRVYLLQFNNSSRRFFFWMQGKKEDDPENCRKLNEYMSNPPAVPVGSLGGGGSGGGGNADQNAMMQLLSQFGGGGAGGAQLNESQLQSVLQGLGMGGAGSSRGNSSSSRSQRRRGSEGDDDDEEDNSGRSNRRNRDNDDDDEVASPVPVQAPEPRSPDQASSSQTTSGQQQQQFTAEDLQRALAGVSNAMQQQQQQPRMPPLTEIYKASEIAPMLQDPAIRDELINFLPEDRQTEEELRYTLTSPQVRQALAMLSHALQSENFNAIMANFGLDPMAGAAELQRGDGIGAFLRALQAKADEDDELYQ